MDHFTKLEREVVVSIEGTTRLISQLAASDAVLRNVAQDAIEGLLYLLDRITRIMPEDDRDGIAEAA